MGEAIDRNSGKLRGPSSTSLRLLVTELEGLNFIGDQTIEQQIEKLRSVLPTEAESAAAARQHKGIDTSHMRRVLHDVGNQAAETLLELGLEPRRRARKSEALIEDTGLLSLSPRRPRRKEDHQ